jgi:hypothetical protein
VERELIDLALNNPRAKRDVDGSEEHLEEKFRHVPASVGGLVLLLLMHDVEWQLG